MRFFLNGTMLSGIEIKFPFLLLPEIIIAYMENNVNRQHLRYFGDYAAAGIFYYCAVFSFGPLPCTEITYA